MSSHERWLPIFPLSTVLFPNAALPLQIFEERYKLMMQHCLDSDSKMGVVLIKSGAEVGEPAIPHSTGTVAHIVQVNKIEGGRMFVSVTGQQRFQIRNITQYRPYLAADVEILEENTEASMPPSEMEAVRRAVTQYLSLILGMRGGWIRETRFPSDPLVLSYFIAGMLQIDLPEKQALLEQGSASRRLEAELDLLRREAQTLAPRVTHEMRTRFSRQ